MAIAHIKPKCITVARDYARKNSTARLTGVSVFFKRYYGSYHLIAVVVTPKQRSCRDIFAEAQKLASRELKQWNRHRFWSRQAKHHRVKGAHRMAVSHFYRLLKQPHVQSLGTASTSVKTLIANVSQTKSDLIRRSRRSSPSRRCYNPNTHSQDPSSSRVCQPQSANKQTIFFIME